MSSRLMYSSRAGDDPPSSADPAGSVVRTCGSSGAPSAPRYGSSVPPPARRQSRYRRWRGRAPGRSAAWPLWSTSCEGQGYQQEHGASLGDPPRRTAELCTRIPDTQYRPSDGSAPTPSVSRPGRPLTRTRRARRSSSTAAASDSVRRPSRARRAHRPPYTPQRRQPADRTGRQREEPRVRGVGERPPAERRPVHRERHDRREELGRRVGHGRHRTAPDRVHEHRRDRVGEESHHRERAPG